MNCAFCKQLLKPTRNQHVGYHVCKARQRLMAEVADLKARQRGFVVGGSKSLKRDKMQIAIALTSMKGF